MQTQLTKIFVMKICSQMLESHSKCWTDRQTDGYGYIYKYIGVQVNWKAKSDPPQQTCNLHIICVIISVASPQVSFLTYAFFS